MLKCQSKCSLWLPKSSCCLPRLVSPLASNFGREREIPSSRTQVEERKVPLDIERLGRRSIRNVLGFLAGQITEIYEMDEILRIVNKKLLPSKKLHIHDAPDLSICVRIWASVFGVQLEADVSSPRSNRKCLRAFLPCTASPGQDLGYATNSRPDDLLLFHSLCIIRKIKESWRTLSIRKQKVE